MTHRMMMLVLGLSLAILGAAPASAQESGLKRPKRKASRQERDGRGVRTGRPLAIMGQWRREASSQ